MTKTEIEEAVMLRLRSPLLFHWHGHGIGMLRTYLDDARTIRMNVWHSRMLNRGISTLHTHERPFESMVMSGRLTNIIYERVSLGTSSGALYDRGRISCGDRFKGIEEIDRVKLVRMRDYDLFAGHSYEMMPIEIHDTKFMDGTVTVQKWGAHASDHAHVFWPCGEGWGDATRATTQEDVEVVLSQARALYGMRVKR